MSTYVEIDFKTSNTNITTIESGTEDIVSNLSEAANRNIFQGYKGMHFCGTDNTKAPSDMTGAYQYYGDEGYKGYISNIILGVTGNLIGIRFKFQGTVPDVLSVRFDRICNEFATEMFIEYGTRTITVNNMSTLAFIDISSLNINNADTEIILYITKWNKPYKNVKITSIMFGYTGVFYESTLTSIKASNQIVSTVTKYVTGINKQYADLTFYDRYQEFLNAAKHELLQELLPVRIYIEDVLVGDYRTNEWDVSGTSPKVGLNCTDDIAMFENITIPSLSIPNKNPNLGPIEPDRNLHDIIVFILTTSLNVAWQYDNSYTETFCKNIIIPDSWMVLDFAGTELKKVCEIGQLCIYYSKGIVHIVRAV